MGFHTAIPQQVNLDYVELFAGMGCVSLGLMSGGFRGSSHDIDHSSRMDLTTVSGFLYLGNGTGSLSMGSENKHVLVDTGRNVYQINCSTMHKNAKTGI